MEVRRESRLVANASAQNEMSRWVKKTGKFWLKVMTLIIGVKWWKMYCSRQGRLRSMFRESRWLKKAGSSIRWSFDLYHYSLYSSFFTVMTVDDDQELWSEGENQFGVV